MRVLHRRRVAKWIGLFLGLFAALPFLFHLEAMLWGLIIVFFGCAMVQVYIRDEASRYQIRCKQTLMGEIARFVAPNCRYDPEDWISREEFEQSGLLPLKLHGFTGEDLFWGHHEKTEFRFSECQYLVERSSICSNWVTESQVVPDFKGILFIADFHKHFQRTTLLLPDLGRASGRSPAAILPTEAAELSLERVRLEDPEFDQAFSVFSTDQIEARYLLSPSLMCRINRFQKKTGLPMWIAFRNSKLFVALPSRMNRFEVNLDESILNPTCCRRLFEEFEFAFALIDDLNLNTRIWSKA